MGLILPTAIIGQTDVNRLLRELNGLNDFFVGVIARKAGTPVSPPRTSQLLDDLARTNKLNLLEEKSRAKLTKQLQNLLVEAPKLRISFAVDPPTKVLEIILSWMRQNLDPGVLLQIGLQPNIGAGCILRTTNREFDLSMRQHLIQSTHYLNELIRAAAKSAEIQPPPQGVST